MKKSVLVALALGLGLVATASHAQPRSASTSLRGFEEVPVVSTPARGTFQATLNGAQTELTYELSYNNLQGSVTQAHIHIGQRDVNGGIMIWLCSNLASPPTPAGTPPCPGPHAGEVSRTVDESDVVGPAGQGITAGEFAEALRAMRNGVSYANVHTDAFPGGEIRGQLRFGRGGDDATPAP